MQVRKTQRNRVLTGRHLLLLKSRSVGTVNCFHPQSIITDSDLSLCTQTHKSIHKTCSCGFSVFNNTNHLSRPITESRCELIKYSISHSSIRKRLHLKSSHQNWHGAAQQDGSGFESWPFCVASACLSVWVLQVSVFIRLGMKAEKSC